MRWKGRFRPASGTAGARAFPAGKSPLPAFFILCTVLVLLRPAFVVAQEKDLDERIRNKEGELDKLRKSISQERRRIKELEEKEKDVSKYLEKLEKEEGLTRELLEGLAEKQGMLEEQVEDLRGALETNEKIYRHRLAVLSRRLREMYKDGPRHVWQELLDARDFADLLQRYKFLSLVAERDAALVDDVLERRAGIERQEAGITELLHEVTVSRREKEVELGRLRENEKKRKETLSDLKHSKEKRRKKIDELAKAQEQLQSFIEELEKRRLEQAKAWGAYGEKEFLKLRGRMERPVEGPTVREFGRFKHPEFGTVTFNTGLDIGAREGSPVRAVARGRVEYASVLPGYDNCIIINHGGGYYTLYAHTSRILVDQGDQVERGTVIAEVGGGTGSAGSLHFEIRKSKKALDPAEWLKK